MNEHQIPDYSITDLNDRSFIRKESIRKMSTRFAASGLITLLTGVGLFFDPKEGMSNAPLWVFGIGAIISIGAVTYGGMATYYEERRCKREIEERKAGYKLPSDSHR